MTATAATLLEQAPHGLVPGRDVWLKREDLHELGSFKWRGALPALEHFKAGGAVAVVTASTGNHGAATAWAASRLGLRAIVYVPQSASRAKLALIERFGADIRQVGADVDAAKEEASGMATAEGLPFFEDGAEPAQYGGYRSIGVELLEQLPAPPAAVVVPVGNGALLGGLGLELCERCPDTLRIGAAAQAAPVMAESWEAGSAVPSTESETFADGLAVRVAIPFANRFLLVSERAIARAVGQYAAAGIRAEGAAGAALAAVEQLEPLEGPVVLIVTGGNIDDDLHRRAVEDPESFAE